MKKIGVAVLLLMLLFLVVGVFLVIRAWNNFGDRPARAVGGPRLAEHSPRSTEQGRPDARTTDDPRLVSSTGRTPGLGGEARSPIAGSPSDGDAPEAGEVDSIPAGEPPSIFFIRSSSIVGAGERKEEDLKVLQEACAQVLANYPVGTLLFDLDAVSAIQEPVLIHANPDLDLSSMVTAVYTHLIELQDP